MPAVFEATEMSFCPGIIFGKATAARKFGIHFSFPRIF